MTIVFFVFMFFKVDSISLQFSSEKQSGDKTNMNLFLCFIDSWVLSTPIFSTLRLAFLRPAVSVITVLIPEISSTLEF